MPCVQFPHKYEMGTVMGIEVGIGWALDGHWMGIVDSLEKDHIARVALTWRWVGIAGPEYR